jgi:hypothetical protein
MLAAAATPALFLAALSVVFLGCTMPRQSVSVTVGLPETPELWADLWGPSGYRISWQAYPAVSGVVEVGSGVGTVVLDLPKGCVVPVLAWPVWGAGGPALQPTEMLRPAGGIFCGSPAQDNQVGGSSDGAGLDLTYANGPAAYTLCRAAASGAAVQVFNHERLVAEIPVRLPQDPWLLDTNRVVRALCEGSMRADYIREVSRSDVWLEVPDGTWFDASPYGAQLNGGYQELTLRTGLTPYYDNSGRRLVVVVDEEDRVWCAISPPG